MQESLNPTVGERVLTSDGESLGEVKEISGSYFKVDVSMGRDYWLNASSVTMIEDGAVCLSFPKSDLDSYKRGAPDP